MKVLVGSTGLIGKTLSDKTTFELTFNSSNIDTFADVVPNGCDLYLSCLPATMWMVNKDVVADVDNLLKIIKNISGKKYKNIYVFSTIEVYCDSPSGVDESYLPGFNKVIYGSNRYMFELLVKQTLEYESIKIFRLPALFGNHLKKNIFYDLLNSNQVEKINTSSVYQWYNLDNLWQDVLKCATINEELFNLFSEPVATKDLVSDVFDLELENDLGPKFQDFRTKHSVDGYWSSKEDILNQMKAYLDANRHK